MTTVAAWADDLRAQPGLLRAWAREFTAADDVTLVVLGDPADADLYRFERDAVEAGLGAEDTADVVGLPLPDAQTARAVIEDAAAILSGAPGAGAFGRPVVDQRVNRAWLSRIAHGDVTAPPVAGPGSWLAGRPWLGIALPEPLLAAPTMLAPGELALLYVLARDHSRGAGRIVDAGCFFGGSTLALASGLAAAGVEPARQIESYDLFELDEVYLHTSPHLVQGMAPGDSFLPVFERTVGPRLRPYVNVHAGDLLAHPWPGDPIDVLFVDVAKIWSLGDHVAREFFPALVPGHSVVVQQDYVHEWLPWLHITMDLFADRFELVDFVPGTGSAVFVCTAAIDRDEVPRDLRAEMPDAEKLERFDRAAARFHGVERGVIELARAVLLKDMGDVDAARGHVAAVVDAYGDHRRVADGATSMGEYFDLYVAP